MHKTPKESVNPSFFGVILLHPGIASLGLNDLLSRVNEPSKNLSATSLGLAQILGVKP